MASYALLGALAGFRYSAAQRTLWFGPKIAVRPFQTFFSTANGFGTVVLDASSVRVEVVEGELNVDKLVLTEGSQTQILDWKTTARPDAPTIKNI
jgi:hypothetical protein